MWKELQEYHEKRFPISVHRPLNLCGGLMIGKPDSEVVSGTLRSIRQHNLPHQILSAEEVRRKYEVFNLTDDEIGIWEGNAGYLHPEVVIETYIQMAEQFGARARYGERFVSFQQICDSSNGLNLLVETSQRTYRCKKLILTVGAWAKEFYGASLPFPIRLERRVLYWFEPAQAQNPDHRRAFQHMPVYIWDMGKEKGNFYGFPEQRGYEGSVKVAIHYNRFTDGKACDSPATVDREVAPWEIETMRGILAEKIPRMNGTLKETATCMYTLTPDEHFLIDFHPSNPHVVLASPCSGHGFKFCSVVGEVLSQLAVEGRTPHDIDLFRIRTRALLSKL